MRTTGLTAALVLALAAFAGCDSSTEPEQPRAKTGLNAELAIELPLTFTPGSRGAHVDTEWWVIQGGEFWFRNLSETPIDLELMVTNPFTSESNIVGSLLLAARATAPIRLNRDYTSDDYRYHSWVLKYAQGDVQENVAVRFGS